MWVRWCHHVLDLGSVAADQSLASQRRHSRADETLQFRKQEHIKAVWRRPSVSARTSGFVVCCVFFEVGGWGGGCKDPVLHPLQRRCNLVVDESRKDCICMICGLQGWRKKLAGRQPRYRINVFLVKYYLPIQKLHQSHSVKAVSNGPLLHPSPSHTPSICLMPPLSVCSHHKTSRCLQTRRLCAFDRLVIADLQADGAGRPTCI